MVSKWIVILAVVIGLSWLCLLGFAQEESDMDSEKLVIKKAYDKALIDFKKGKRVECDCEHCRKAGVKAKTGELKIIGEGEGKIIRIKEGKIEGHPEIIHTHDGKIEGHTELIHTRDGRMILKSHGNAAHVCTEEIGMLELAECHEEGDFLICGSEGDCIELLACEECPDCADLLECDECEICVECEECEACVECEACEECEECEIILSTGDASHDLRRIIRSKGDKDKPALLLSTLFEDEEGRRIVEHRLHQAHPAPRAVPAARPLASTHRLGRAPSRLEEKYNHGNEKQVQELGDQIDDLRGEVRDLHKIVKQLQKHIERMAH
jgi:hypothetical protein